MYFPIHRCWVLVLWLAVALVGCENHGVKRNPEPIPVAIVPKSDSAARAEIKILVDIGRRQKRAQQMDSVIGTLYEALEIGTSWLASTDTVTSRLWYQLGTFQRKFGYIPSALRSFQNGLKCVTARPCYERRDLVEECEFLNAIGMQYSRVMRLDSAESYTKRSIVLRKELFGTASHDYAFALQNLGIVFQNLGKLREADSLMQMSYAVEKRLNVPANLAITLQCMGEVDLVSGDSAAAFSCFRQGLRSCNLADSNQAYVVAKLYEGIAASAQATQTFQQTTDQFTTALRIMEKAGLAISDRERAYVELSQGNFYQTAHRPDLALRSFHNALCHFAPFYNDTAVDGRSEIFALGHEPSIFLALCGKAHAWETLDGYDLDCAFDCYRQAFVFADKLRRSYGSLEEKINLMGWIYPEYESALAMALDQYQQRPDEKYLEWYFELMERSKANELLDAFDQVDATHEYSLPDSILGKGRKLGAELDLAREAMSSGNGDRLRCDSLEKAWMALQDWIKVHYPGMVKTGLDYVSWSAVRASLGGRDTLLLEYFLGKDQLFVLAANGGRDTAFVVPWDSTMEATVDLFLAAMDSMEMRDVEHNLAAPAYFLFQKLVSPALKIGNHLGKLPPRIIVVPDGKLAFIPFEALLTASVPTGTKSKQLPYLIQSSVLSYLQSMQLQYRLQHRPVSRAGNGLLGMGSSRPLGPGLDPLRHAASEAAMAVAHIGGETALDGAATEARFKLRSPWFDMIHLSTHGLVDRLAPLRSHLVFHRDSLSEDDGKIMAFEMYGLDLHAELAVLSACRSADGQVLPGMGVLSLGRSFLEAGCANAIMTQRDVSDAVSEEIMTNFYDELVTGQDVATALQQARVKFLKDADASEALPAHWAPFILQGPGNHSILLQQGNPRWPWLVVCGVALLLGCIAWRLRVIKRARLKRGD